MKKADQEKILKAAKAEGERWLQMIKFDGKSDKAKILEVLSSREFNGKKCIALIVDCPTELPDAVRRGVEKLGGTKGKLSPWRCIWDYYLSALYESSYHQLPKQDHPFMEQSLFPAFEAGLGFLVNLGGILVGITRPEAHRDPEARIHHDSGPAIIWGRKRSWWWHGVKVDQRWIEAPESLTKKDFKAVKNQEERRAFCEILGWEKVLKLLGSRKIQADDWGTLRQVQLDDDDGKPARFADVTCPSSGRRYLIRTDPAVATCKAALANSATLEPEDYEFGEET